PTYDPSTVAPHRRAALVNIQRAHNEALDAGHLYAHVRHTEESPEARGLLHAALLGDEHARGVLADFPEESGHPRAGIAPATPAERRVPRLAEHEDEPRLHQEAYELGRHLGRHPTTYHGALTGPDWRTIGVSGNETAAQLEQLITERRAAAAAGIPGNANQEP